jgi:hypothetical protein
VAARLNCFPAQPTARACVFWGKRESKVRSLAISVYAFGRLSHILHRAGTSGRPQGRVLRQCLWSSFTLTVPTTITALPYVPYGQPHRNVGDSLGFAHCVRQTVSSDYIDGGAYSSNIDLVYEASFPHFPHHCPVMKSDFFLF